MYHAAAGKTNHTHPHAASRLVLLFIVVLIVIFKPSNYECTILSLCYFSELSSVFCDPYVFIQINADNIMIQLKLIIQLHCCGHS